MEVDKKFILELNKPLGISRKPFSPIAKRLGWSEEKVLSTLKDYKAKGLLRRFGAILGHQNIGLKTNALVAWKVPQKRINCVARILKGVPPISHCYLRSSYLLWPYNLYTMLHCRDKNSCLLLLKSIAQKAGIKDYRVLFTLKEFKKTKSNLLSLLR